MGSRAAMLLSLLHPVHISSLVSVDASPIHSTTPGGIRAMETFLRTLNAVDFSGIDPAEGHVNAKARVEEQLLSGIPDTSLRQWLLLNVILDRESGVYKWQMNLRPLTEGFPGDLILVPAREEWRPFRGRSLFIGGEKSKYIPLDDHDAIREQFPNAELTYVRNAGHYVQADNPKGFMDALLPFLLG